MKRLMMISLVVAVVCVAPGARAADDGQTQPKINYAFNTSHSSTVDLIATTNGSGNVKGVQCIMGPDGLGLAANAVVKFYVNGGAAQSVTINGDYVPDAYSNDAGRSSGWVPFNVRFTSSIRITIQKETSSGGNLYCAASWALD